MIKKCLHCQKDFNCKPSHFNKRVHCSAACMAETYKKKLLSENNPNYKNTHKKICGVCKTEFSSYKKSSVYCSFKCYSDLRKSKVIVKEKTIKPKKIKLEKPKRLKVLWECKQCNKKMETCKSLVKTYCSYKCHLDSGGALRAGKASAGMMKKYGAKKDANHSEIVKAFKDLMVHVLDFSNVGRGMPDLLVWVQKQWIFVDVKNPNTSYGKRGLNKRQKEWANEWQGGCVYLVSNLSDVENLVKGNFKELKRFPEKDKEYTADDAFREMGLM